MQERNQTYLRRKNKEDIINLLRERSQSYSDIARALKLSNTAVGKIADALIADDLIVRDGDTKGRTGINLRINADFGYVIAIDLSGKKLTICAADFASNILMRREIDEVVTFLKHDLDALIDEVRSIVNSAECAGKKLCCIGIASPGIIDSASGEFLLNPRFRGFKSLSIGKVFSDEFKCRTVVRNDINLALEGEKTYGTYLKDVDNALMLHIDVGTGAALMVGGKVYEGTRGRAGEIGYFKLNMFATDNSSMENLSYANYYDSISLYSSLAVVSREIAENANCPLALKLADEGKTYADLTIKQMVEAYASGDETARRVINASGKIIGTVASNLAEFLDMDVILINGAAVELGDEFLRVLSSCLKGRCVRYSELAENAPLMGAVNTALTQAFADNI